MITLRDRFFGCFFGAVVGDVLGMPYEFSSQGTFTFDGTMEAGGPFFLEAGQYTDDTSMMVAMAQSILSQNRIDAHNQAIHYLLWYQHGQYSSTGACFDIGDQTRTALDFYDRTGRFMEESTRAGNGSLMRVAPAILFGLHQHRNVFEAGIRETCINTHNAQEAIEYTTSYSTLVQRVLIEDGLVLDDIDAILAGYDFGDSFRAGGYIVTSYYAALRSFRQTDSFRDCMIDIINLGGDTDTNACIAGMLAGAHYGLSGIQHSWLYNIQDYEYLYKLCEALWDRVRENSESAQHAE